MLESSKLKLGKSIVHNSRKSVIKSRGKSFKKLAIFIKDL